MTDRNIIYYTYSNSAPQKITFTSDHISEEEMPFSAYDVVEISDVEDLEHDPELSMEDDLRVQMTGQLTSVIDKVTMFLSFCSTTI